MLILQVYCLVYIVLVPLYICSNKVKLVSERCRDTLSEDIKVHIENSKARSDGIKYLIYI